MIDHIIGFLAFLTAILIILAVVCAAVGILNWIMLHELDPWMLTGVFGGGAFLAVALASLLMWASR